MNRGLLVCALALGLVLPASAPAAATDAASTTTTSSAAEAVLETATVDAALFPPEPSVVTDAQLAGVGASPGVQQLNTHANQLVVDDDLAQCPNADFTTPAGIQAAIEAAPPGAKIRVCPGNYSPINVHKPDLWLQAARTHGNANQCREGNPAQDAMIAGTNAAGLVQIVASGVRFEGFIVHGNTAGPGIRTDATGSGYELVFNEVRANQYGIDLNTNGLVETLIEHNCLRDNTVLRSGVLSSSGFSNVQIENNFFTGHRCVAIANMPPAAAAPCIPVGNGTPVGGVTVEHNSFIRDATVAFDGATDVVLDANEWLGHFGAAVLLTNVIGADVSYNHVDGTGDQSQGILIDGGEGVSVDTVIRNNKIENLQGGISGTFQFFGFAIRVQGGVGVAVEQNWIQFNRGTGIHLRPRADAAVVHGNLLVGNGFPGTDAAPVVSGSDGIRISQGSVGNTIENNRLGEPLQGEDPEERANRDHDCHDDNPNGANVWRHNVGYTENQPGLCVRPA